MNLSQEILSQIIIYSKYARYNNLIGRRETWEEIVTRNKNMHIRKFPNMKDQIEDAYKLVYDKKILPSMRSLQFGGTAIEVNNARLFNCSYLPIDDYRAFSEAFFLLLSGCGVGYSVQRHHVERLPRIMKPKKQRKFLISDDVMGWADAVKALMKAYFGFTAAEPVFDYRSIRAQGEPLKTSGGVAPGPGPLRVALGKIKGILENKKEGTSLTPLECHDIMCHIADSVLAGGIRRSAMISLFDKNDDEMLTCKFGNWWELNPQRGRANNSVVLERKNISHEYFMDLWKKVELSNSGEPGFYFTHNKDWGTNPCCFTGDMRLLTPEGYKRFDELAKDGASQFINVNGDVVEGCVWESGHKGTVNVYFNDMTRIRCTPDHRFMLNDGSECEAKDLKGKRVMPFFSINKEINKFVKWGFIQGDGSTSRLNSETHRGLEVCFGEKDMDVAEIFGFESTGRQYISGMNEDLIAFGIDAEPLPFRGMPFEFNKKSEYVKKSFLKGMYSANGSVIKTSRVAYKTTSFVLANELLDVLKSFGLNPYITTNKAKTVEFQNGNYECKESYDVNIGRIKDIIWFASNIGFIHGYKNEALSNLIKSRGPIVDDVLFNEADIVYDFSLDDDTHWGVVEGVIAHNCEIGLKPFQFCNLVEVNASDIKDQIDLNHRVGAAAVIGTLQASYTDFHYLRQVWQRTTEEDALLGIGMTGIASNALEGLKLEEAVDIAKAVNKQVSNDIKINEAARITCVKPSGTSSIVLGTSSGIHAWHDQYYIRRVRVGKEEPLYKYLSEYAPEIIEDDFFKPNEQGVISIPQSAPEGSVLRNEETALQFLERIKRFSTDWIKPGHRTGDNTHNISATVTIDDSEWEEVGEWLWNNKDYYNGLSFLPKDLGTYVQTPFESTTKEVYDQMMSTLHDIDLRDVREGQDNTNLMGEAACSSGGCEVS